MGLPRSAPAIAAACAGLLAACVSGAPATTVSPVAAVAPPPSGWQWADASGGPAVTLTASEVAPAASGARSASLRIVCNAAVPSVMVAWDSPVAPAASSSLTYRFDGEPERAVSARAAGPQTEVVSDPLVVSRFLDEAADGRRLVVRTGATEAAFSTTDDAGNLRRFRTECPSGTN